MNRQLQLAFSLSAIIASGFWAESASASVVLSDNFDTSSAMANWPGDAVFQSIPAPGNVPGLASVDLVGPGFFPSLAFSGNSVDLDGSTGSGNDPAGELQSMAILPVGNYTVQFELAGNLRGATPQTTEVSIGSKTFSFTPPSTMPYTLETLHFYGVSGNVSFTDNGPSDQQGNLVDNISVTTGVPEPQTWAMMLLGFAGIFLAGYRRTNKNLPLAA